jgi:hypothetical protein
MTLIVGVIGAALLFGLFTSLRPSDKGCAGNCVGCTRDGACESKNDDAMRENARSVE